MSKKISAYWPIILIVLVVGFFFLLHLGRDQLWDWDECIYAGYAQQMKATGNFLVNRWNGILGFEKPPLYGMILQIPTLFKTNEFTLRIASVVFSLITLVVQYIFAKKYFSEKTALISTFTLLAAEVYVIYSLRVSTDPGYMMFILCGIFLWILSFKKSRFAYAAGIFFGLAVMIKGLSVSSFLLAVFISIFIPYRKEKLINFVRLMGAFAILTIPWHIYMVLVYKDRFLYTYIYENLIKRANNPIEFHLTGRLFYVKQLFSQFFPWILILASVPLYYLAHIKNFLKLKQILKEVKDREIIILIVLCIVIPFAILTKAQTRLPWYALPMYPFLALFIGYVFNELLSHVKHKGAPVIFYILLTLIACDAGRLIYNETRVFDYKAQTEPRNLAFIASQKYPEDTLTYLTPYSERRGREVLPESMTTTYTFSYGGTTCSPYYSHKKVIIFYNREEFIKSFAKKGLFVIENGDLVVTEHQPIQILYQSTDHTLFRL